MNWRIYTGQFEQQEDITHLEAEITKSDLAKLLTDGFIIHKIYDNDKLAQVICLKLKGER